MWENEGILRIFEIICSPVIASSYYWYENSMSTNNNNNNNQQYHIFKISSSKIYL